MYLSFLFAKKVSSKIHLEYAIYILSASPRPCMKYVCKSWKHYTDYQMNSLLLTVISYYAGSCFKFIFFEATCEILAFLLAFCGKPGLAVEKISFCFAFESYRVKVSSCVLKKFCVCSKKN